MLWLGGMEQCVSLPSSHHHHLCPGYEKVFSFTWLESTCPGQNMFSLIFFPANIFELCWWKCLHTGSKQMLRFSLGTKHQAPDQPGSVRTSLSNNIICSCQGSWSNCSNRLCVTYPLRAHVDCRKGLLESNKIVHILL